MLFENYTPMTGIFMRRKIEEVLSNYEPRASLSSIQVNEQMDRNAIDVVVNFYVLNLPNPVSVTTTLQRIR
jgi:phage baseplate assembly protein W